MSDRLSPALPRREDGWRFDALIRAEHEAQKFGYGVWLRLLARLYDREARLRAAEAERDKVRAALSSCAGFLVGLRDDNHGYDFTVAHNEQIARLCHEAWNALAKYREVAG